MALQLPLNFKNDIQSKDTALVPIVFIGDYVYSPENNYSDTEHWVNNAIIISTNQISNFHYSIHEVFPNIEDSNITTRPILLNVPSLKESINIEKRNYKISSVNIDISNLPYEGKRFSELVSQFFEDSLINMQCRIYWWSPSTTSISPLDMRAIINDSDAFQVYFGTIRKYEHNNDDKVRLVLEDRSQATLHKDLPLPNTGQQTNWLGTGDDVPNKYKNKPIPMVYGYVDKSPCVIGEQTLQGEMKIFADNATSSSTFSGSNPLLIFRDDKYLEVLENNHGIITHWGYSKGRQYTPVNSIFLIEIPYIQDVDTLDVKNPLGENLCAVKLTDSDYTFKLYTPLDNYTIEEVFRKYVFEAFLVTDMPWIVKDTADYDTYYEYRIQLIFDRLNKVDENSHQDSTEAHITYIINYDWNAEADEWSDRAEFIDVRMQPDNDGTVVIIADSEGLDSTTSSGVSQLPGTNISYIRNTGWVNDNIAEQALYSQTLSVHPSFVHATGYSNIIMNDVERISYFLIDKFRTQRFYANVIGRLGNPTAPELLASITDTELGFSGADNTNHPEYANWWSVRYAFTIDKKINSKKLFENIASTSPYIPRFNNMGEFEFNVIPMNGGISIPEEENGMIQEADVIDYSFSRTEDIYTKIEFKYRWDYARKEFDKELEIQYQGSNQVYNYVSTDMLQNDGFLNPSYYTPEYYGLNPDHSESTLVIDDDRGKYIRDDYAAESFAHWFLSWHCNQHLKMKIRLPLKYMNLEIGDIIKVGDNGVLGGVKPYGIDYTLGGQDVNGQLVYNRFIIFKTNKTLEYCEIECIQLHQLTDGRGSLVDDEECPSGYYDCTGVCGGDWFNDACDPPNCVEELDYDLCPHDCNGEYNGTATLDCAGVCNGTSIVNECGMCGDGSAGMVEDSYGDECCEDLLATDCLYDFDTECCVSICGGCGETDCAGVPNGDSIICGIDGSCNLSDDCPDPELDLNPISIPGTDVAAEANDIITLNGWQSFDIDGFIRSYMWFFSPLLSNAGWGPEDFLQAQQWDSSDWHTDLTTPVEWRDLVFVAPDISDPYFTWCDGEWPYFCIFRAHLKVTDDEGNDGYNHLYLTVYNELEAPVAIADAGPDQVFIKDFQDFGDPDNKIYLDGSNSYTTAPGGYLIAWEWTQIEGPPVTILPDEGSEDPSGGSAVDWTPTYFIAPLASDDAEEWNYVQLTFRLAVFDNYFNPGENEVTITIMPCPLRGDINFDGTYNVLDVVVLANCVLANNCHELEYGCAGDMNGDGAHNVLDIVSLAGCIISGTCGD